MIDTAIGHIAGHLNQYLRRTFDLNEDIVVISNILEQDGNIAANIDNKVVVSLINIEKETVPLPNHTGNTRAGNTRAGNTREDNRSIICYPPVYLNFYLMFSGSFSGSNYLESLKFVSNTISYFQGNPVFDHHNTPDLDDQISQLTMNIENLTMHDLSNLWSVLSGKYLPSVLYKVRMITFDSRDVRAQVASITQTDSLVGGQ